MTTTDERPTSNDQPPTATEELPIPNDGCPDWASQLMLRIRELEIKLGNITPNTDHFEANIAKIYDRLGDETQDYFDDTAAEELFQKVCRRLSDDGVPTTQIAAFINARVRGISKLPYCSAAEVAEATLGGSKRL